MMPLSLQAANNRAARIGKRYAVYEERFRPHAGSTSILTSHLALTPGTRLGVYDIIAAIGEGGNRSVGCAICFATGKASSRERHGPAREPLRQILTVDEFHHEGGHGLAFFQAVDRGDVRMIEGGQHFRFAPKTRELIGIGRERRRQDLDRDLRLSLASVARYTCPIAEWRRVVE
jgi:hypothetical protein